MAAPARRNFPPDRCDRTRQTGGQRRNNSNRGPAGRASRSPDLALRPRGLAAVHPACPARQADRLVAPAPSLLVVERARDLLVGAIAESAPPNPFAHRS